MFRYVSDTKIMNSDCAVECMESIHTAITQVPARGKLRKARDLKARVSRNY